MTGMPIMSPMRALRQRAMALLHLMLSAVSDVARVVVF